MRNQPVRMLVLALLALLIIVFPTLAHEGREVGEYQLTFGWREEPAYAGLINGPEIYIALASESHGHSDEGEEAHEHTDEASAPGHTADLSTLEVSLQAEVTFGDQSIVVNFRPAWGETGHYIAELMPTLPGDYTFHVTGTIGDTAVDEVFTSADGDFSSVEPATDVMFPVLPTVDNARIEVLEARIAELEAQLAALQSS